MSITPAGIGRYGRTPCTVTVFDTVDSTNTRLKADAASLPAGTVYVARCQTAGRGRQGHTFFSPEATGIYFSVLLRPQAAGTAALSLTAAAAVAVCRAVERCTDRTATVKWVNDIECDGRKVCGILAEGVWDGSRECITSVVLGIGINVAPPAGGFPPEIAGRAGALWSAPPPDEAVERLVATVLDELADLTAGDRGRFYEEYRRRCLERGTAVEVLPYGAAHGRAATVTDVLPDFSLQVCWEDTGETAVLTSGEIRIR